MFSLRELLSPHACDLLLRVSSSQLLSYSILLLDQVEQGTPLRSFTFFCWKILQKWVTWALTLPCTLQEEILLIPWVDWSSRLGHHGSKPWLAYPRTYSSSCIAWSSILWEVNGSAKNSRSKVLKKNSCGSWIPLGFNVDQCDSPDFLRSYLDF